MRVVFKLLSGGDAGREFAVSEGETKVFGRSQAADFPIDDGSLSRQHFSASVRGGVGKIADLQSTNGTFLNGCPVKECPLEDGDRIAIGHVLLEVRYEQQAPQGASRPGAGSAPPAETRYLSFCTRCRRAMPAGQVLGAPVVCDACRSLPERQPGISRVGPYVIHEKLRDEALGPVYKAVQEGLNRVVGIKLISPDGPVTETVIQRFVREAKVGGHLDHPNIVPLLDAGEADGVYFITVEHVEGESLRARISRVGALAAPEVVALGLQIASALHHAAGRGFIHRNVRPETIIIDPDGQALLTDFGLAKALNDPGISGVSGIHQGKMRAAYLAPEQFVGHMRLDPRTDVYGLGVTLYEAATGKRAFDGKNLLQVMKHASGGEFAPIRQLSPTVPQALASAIEKAMSARPEQRFPSAEAFAAALNVAQKGGGTVMRRFFNWGK